jgi:hypothetical protein
MPGSNSTLNLSTRLIRSIVGSHFEFKHRLPSKPGRAYLSTSKPCCSPLSTATVGSNSNFNLKAVVVLFVTHEGQRLTRSVVNGRLEFIVELLSMTASNSTQIQLKLSYGEAPDHHRNPVPKFMGQQIFTAIGGQCAPFPEEISVGWPVDCCCPPKHNGSFLS